MLARALQTIGILALLGLVALMGWLGFAEYRNVDRRDALSAAELAALLRHGGLSESKGVELVRSAQSARSQGGGHLDHFCLSLEELAIAPASREHWQLPVDVDKPYSAVLKQAYELGEGEACLGAASLETISDIRANLISASFSSGQPRAFRTLFYEPLGRRLLYVSYQR